MRFCKPSITSKKPEESQGSVNEFIDDFEKTASELRGCGCSIQNNKLIYAIPDTWGTLEFVKSELLTEEATNENSRRRLITRTC